MNHQPNNLTEISLEAAIMLFLADQIKTTAYSYRYVLDNFSGFIGKEQSMQAIKPQAVVKYMQDVRARPAIKSPATVNKYTKTIKTFLNWCIRMNFIDKSPADVIKYINTSKYIRTEKAMSDEELTKVLDWVKWKPRDHALVLFLADTGCRARGAAGLRVQDIDFDTLTADVFEKGDRWRKCWFGEECAAALKKWLDSRSKDAGEYVFDRDGERLTNPQISRILRRACQFVGIRSLGSHSLRHRKGHQLADAKVSPGVAATALGHQNVNITLEYYYPKDDERAAAAMRELTVGRDKETKKDPDEKIIDFHLKRLSITKQG